MYEEECTCGHEHCGGYKYMAPNPYAEEINGDSTEYFECDGERYESAMDI